MKYLILPIGILLFFLPTIARAESADVNIRLFDNKGEIITSFYPFGEDYRGSGSVSAEDLGDDGVPEIIVGSGPGLSPYVKIYRQDGSLINEFIAYHETYKNGLTVTACDLEGDGTKEIVTGTMFGGGPHVRIFNAHGTTLYDGGFFAYAEAFRGGVNVACGDIDGDGNDDIVTGAGITGGPHIKVFAPNGVMKYEIFSGSAFEDTGVTVAVGDLTGDGTSEIISGRMGVGDPTVTTFDFRRDHLSFIVALNSFDNYENGISVSSGDVDGDGLDEIGVSTNKHENGLIKFFELTGATTSLIKPFTDNIQRGIASATVKNSGTDHILAMSSTSINNDQIGKNIRVDVSEQKLYAFENGVLVNSFLVSTGTWSFPTPLGLTEVSDKLLYHDYVWNYGPGNPNNYALYGVKYNLRFRTHLYIHSAYWHNNFGHRMSHGCINTALADAEWIFNWAQVGTPVEVVE
ncbi:MAG: L,D-transpeptidase family protein [Patescibacteria group bacterium]